MTNACILGFSLVLLSGIVLTTPTTALAAGEPCLRDTECAGAELCIAEACAASEPAPEPCDAQGECPRYHLTCSDGFCKGGGVVCRNPAGVCWVRDGGGTCECGSGEGAGWTDGYNPDDPPVTPTDAELYESCGASLVETCGEDPPSLPESCTGEVLTDCEAFVGKSDHFAMLCGDDVPEVNIARIGHCCDTYSDPLSAAYRACVLAIDSQTCPAQQLDACAAPPGDTDTDDGAASGAGESKEDGEAASRGCSIGAGTGGWSAAIVLLAFAVRVRRRR
jgi:hypothetical protein